MEKLFENLTETEAGELLDLAHLAIQLATEERVGELIAAYNKRIGYLDRLVALCNTGK